MKASEIRRKYLAFFREKGHHVEPSASLVPIDDPSLLWINSGVATYKKYFDGRLTPENPRICNSQKSIRTNDIENVGYTPRHHTFFEMLGNFSIGEYFKKEAIVWAWEFLTSPKWMGFDPEKLSVTIHPEDEEAYHYWHDEVGIPELRIVKLKENFWDIGEGPSGPNSEIFYDRGEDIGDPDDPEMYPGGENERYLEIWNLVFSQFNHNPDGTYTPLPKKNIDTGMGLERMASVVQNVPSNYDTELFQPIIQSVCQKAGVTYGEDEETDIALKVIADHIRTIVFAIADGVLPANEGRGYVLRRLLRRAVRYGRKLTLRESFLYSLTDIVVEIMQGAYPELAEQQDFVTKVIRAEEERFHETLSDGLRILADMVATVKAEQRQQLSGTEAFKLYDTYGFPLDLTVDFAREHGVTVDEEGFNQEMEAQRERARLARQEMDSMQVQDGSLAKLNVNTTFVGYGQMELVTQIEAMLVEQQVVDSIGVGEKALVILAETPFYAESGGQVADTGWLVTEQARIRVEDVQKGPHGEHVHSVVVEEGTFQLHDHVTAKVDTGLRQKIIKNHTATHLLHKALKEVLGEHANQAGSLVAADRLRFDFTHIQALTSQEWYEVEQRVNEQIWHNVTVETKIQSLEEAKAMGAMALFGEKYGNEVRVVQIGDYSLELCGGTHVQQTNEIGLFKMMSESSIGSGIRRIEAITGQNAYEYLERQVGILQKIASDFKTTPDSLSERLEQLQAKAKELANENEMYKEKLSQQAAGELKNQLRKIADVPYIAAHVAAKDMDSLRKVVDDLKRSIGEGVYVLGAVADEKVILVASISAEYVAKGLHAGKLIKVVAAICQGGGGGRPDLAQAGGKAPEKLDEALQQVEGWIETQISHIR